VVKKNIFRLRGFKGRTELDQFSSVLGSMQHNSAVSEKQIDNKRSDRSEFHSFFLIKFLPQNSQVFLFPNASYSGVVLDLPCLDLQH
jgi:hypothetical protein